MGKALLETVDDASPEIIGRCFSLFKFVEKGYCIVENNPIVGRYDSLYVSMIGRSDILVKSSESRS